jgi:NAD(P)-dependent dehydrogenase (short-subunit alcohol dehydrogenase family)
MGRQIVRLLASEGCDVAMCDLSEDDMEESKKLALEGAPSGTKVLTFTADVSDEQQLVAFREAVASGFETDCINLLFNNAGIGGGASFVSNDRAEWERTFGVDWGGVYNSTRVFLPMLLAATEGHVVNTSSINGLWASIGPNMAHTAYSTAKFAVRGFTEALITDFKLNAPHLHASVVMPGHIGTSIVINTAKVLGLEPAAMTGEYLAGMRVQLAKAGFPVHNASDEDLRQGIQMMAEAFRDAAPMSAEEAARVILDGVRENRWRILVGSDAEAIDEQLRADPDHAYDVEFWKALTDKGHFGLS